MPTVGRNCQPWDELVNNNGNNIVDWVNLLTYYILCALFVVALIGFYHRRFVADPVKFFAMTDPNAIHAQSVLSSKNIVVPNGTGQLQRCFSGIDGSFDWNLMNCVGLVWRHNRQIVMNWPREAFPGDSQFKVYFDSIGASFPDISPRNSDVISGGFPFQLLKVNSGRVSDVNSVPSDIGTNLRGSGSDLSCRDCVFQQNDLPYRQQKNDKRQSDLRVVNPVSRHVDGRQASHGYGLLLGLLFIWGCYGGALIAGVAGGSRIRNGRSASGWSLTVAATLLGLTGGVSNAIGPPWLWGWWL
jgi:hypothetical protein